MFFKNMWWNCISKTIMSEVWCNLISINNQIFIKNYLKYCKISKVSTSYILNTFSG